MEKVQREWGAVEMEKNFARENTESEIITFGRDSTWTQLDMNTLSFSWKLPVDR
jgi:hypothetical protein